MYRLILVIFALLVTFSAHAGEGDLQSSFKIVPKGEIFEKDFFAASRGIEISGEVKQDVYAVGSQVIIDGVVNGDVIVIAGTVEIAGVVQGSVRGIAGEVLISGTIGKTLSICSGNIHIASSAKIGGGVVLVSGNADIAGTIMKDVTVAASNVRIASNVEGSVLAFAGQIRLTSRAVIAGQVEYSSSSELWKEPEAIAKGGIHKMTNNLQAIFKHKWLDSVLLGSRVAGFLMNAVYTFAIGCVLIKLYPHNIEATARYLRKTPLKAFFNGVVIAILVPLVSLLLLMTILGVPFALTLIAANIIGFYTAKVYVIYWASESVFDRFQFNKRRLWVFSVGVLVYFLLLTVPYLGSVVSIVSMLTGLGAMVAIQMHRRLGERPNS